MKPDPLPIFDAEGAPDATALRVTGTITSSAAQPPGALHLGESVVFLALGHVAGVLHRHVDDQLVRVHVVKVAEALALEDGEAAVLLTEARDRNAAAIDELLGRRQLPFDKDDDE